LKKEGDQWDKGGIKRREKNIISPFSKEGQGDLWGFQLNA